MRVPAVVVLAGLLAAVVIGMDHAPSDPAAPLSEPRRELPATPAPSPLSGAAPAVTLPAAPPSTSPEASPAWRRPDAPARWMPPATPIRGTPPATPRVLPSPRVPHVDPLTPPPSPGPSRTTLDIAALATKVNPGLVDINTRLSPNLQAAGTGIVLDPSGVVLTNNHVISGATSISVTDVGNGQTYPATVLGYDRSHDIAVIQLQGASGLPIATIGDSGKVAVGDRIAALGNAGGRGGTPSIVAGTVSALHQTVTVSDEITGSSQRLTGMIQVAADIEPGDSGGPLVNAAGEVIGVTTAGSQFPCGRSTCVTGLAIPINDAIAISEQIRAGTPSSTIHIGPSGVMGVLVRGPPPERPGRRQAPRGAHHGSVERSAG